MSRLGKGIRVERKLRAHLLAPHVKAKHLAFSLRSAASKGPIDVVIVCLSCRSMELLNVKANRWPTVAEKRWLQRADKAVRVAPGCYPAVTVGFVMARWQDRAKEPELQRIGR